MTPSPQNNYPQLGYIAFLGVLFVAALWFRKEQVELIIEPVPEPVIEIVELPSDIPDFDSMLDVQEKKTSFFNFLTPYIERINQKILSQRQQLAVLRDKLNGGRSLSRNEMNYLSSLRVAYELDNEMLNTRNLINRLLKRADIIPSSLALAQAANESAWGTSRFAQEGNNFFGQWCYSEGCGIVPNRRREGASHEVKSFDNVLESVEAYIMNLNTFPNYQHLRDIREELRVQGLPIDGITLSEGLDTYSERGNEYIFELQSMIHSNNLLELDHDDA
tara:strand:+ start:311 stop:1138 length:828 start_codon:yes stop_codon:yes gene_type:complete